MVSNKKIKEVYEAYIKEFKENPEETFKQSLKEAYTNKYNYYVDSLESSLYYGWWNEVSYEISNVMIYDKLIKVNHHSFWVNVINKRFIKEATGVSQFNTLEIIENEDIVRKHYAKELILGGNGGNYFVEPYKFDKNSKISERNCKLYVSNIEFSNNVQLMYTTNFSYDIKTLNGLTIRFADGETLVNVGTQHQIDEFSKQRHKLITKYTREIEKLIRELNIPSETLANWLREFKKLRRKR